MGRNGYDHYDKEYFERIREEDAKEAGRVNKHKSRGGWYYPNTIKMKVYKHKKYLMRQRAMSGAEPMLVSEIRKLAITSSKDIEREISGLFPRIIMMVENGDSIARVEMDCGIPERLLSKWLDRNPELNKYIKEARELRRNRVIEDDHEV